MSVYEVYVLKLKKRLFLSKITQKQQHGFPRKLVKGCVVGNGRAHSSLVPIRIWERIQDLFSPFYECVLKGTVGPWRRNALYWLQLKLSLCLLRAFSNLPLTERENFEPAASLRHTHTHTSHLVWVDAFHKDKMLRCVWGQSRTNQVLCVSVCVFVCVCVCACVYACVKLIKATDVSVQYRRYELLSLATSQWLKGKSVSFKGCVFLVLLLVFVCCCFSAAGFNLNPE